MPSRARRAMDISLITQAWSSRLAARSFPIFASIDAAISSAVLKGPYTRLAIVLSLAARLRSIAQRDQRDSHLSGFEREQRGQIH